MGNRSRTTTGRVLRDAPSVELWKCFADEHWREQVLAGGEQKCVELLCNGAIELQFEHRSHEWRGYLPHFLALTCEDLAADRERKRLLFGYVVVASIAVDSVSAVERRYRGPVVGSTRSSSLSGENALSG